ncbi:MAG: thioesterase family protein [Actinomycetota bacterium]
MQLFDFDHAIASSPAHVADGTHHLETEVQPGWDIMGNANGGYLLAIVGRAVASVTGRPDCVTITAHYLAPCPAGRARLEVRPVRSGRRFATSTASLFRVDADGSEREVLRALVTSGDLANDPGGESAMQATMPEIDAYEDCVLMRSTAVNDFAHLHGRLATRGQASDIAFRNGQPSGRASMRGWFEFADERPVDTTALLLASDAFPPAVFNLPLPAGWVPTVELTVHVRAIPAPGPVACFFTTRFVQNGLLEEDGEMWDSSGVLVAQSRQLALAPRS